ncbi:MAG TPA: hypothetical protein VFF06_12575, partial [Polyangia bacterium]|nr:hypothetical protein [Polyangia bacterium]
MTIARVARAACALSAVALSAVALSAIARGDNTVAGAPPAGKLAPAEIEPAIREPDSRFASCCGACGWASDGATLGACSAGYFDQGPLACKMIAGGQRKSAQFPSKARGAAPDFSFQRGGLAWPYGGDLVITW